MAGNVIEYVLRIKDKASPDLKDVADQSDKAGRSLGVTRESMASFAKSAVIASAAVVGVAVALKKVVQSTADARNELNDLSIRTGVAATTIAGLKLAAEGSGQQLSNLEGALASFPKRLADMSRGTGEAKVAFEALGINVKKTDGSLRDADDVFREILMRMGDIESVTVKAGLATQFFGESGGRLIQALGGSTERIAEFVEFADRFGVGVGPAASAAADEWQRSMSTLGTVSEGALAKLVDGITADGGAIRAVHTLAGAIVFLGEIVPPVMVALWRGVVALIEPFDQLVQQIMNGAMIAFMVLSGEFGKAKALAKDFAADMASAPGAIGDAWAVAGAAFADLPDAFSGALTETEAFGRAIDDLSGSSEDLGSVGDGFKALAEAAEDSSDAMEIAFRSVFDQAEDLRQAIDGLVSETPANRLDDLREAARLLSDQLRLGSIAAPEFAEQMERLSRSAVEAEADMRSASAVSAIGTGQQLAGGDVAGVAGQALTAAGPYGAIAAAAVGALASIGAMATLDPETGRVIEGAADEVGDRIMEGFAQILAGVEALPGLLADLIPRIFKDGIPILVDTIAGLIPELIVALAEMMVFQAVQMPFHIAKGIGLAAGALVREIGEAVGRWWEAAKDFIRSLSPLRIGERITGGDGFQASDLLKVAEVGARVALGVATAGISEVVLFAGKLLVDGFKQGLSGEFATGGFVDRTGMALVHQGERIIPASGTGTGTATMLAGGGAAGGVNLTVNTNVVDPNAIPALVREIERTFGSWGRGSSPLFTGA